LASIPWEKETERQRRDSGGWDCEEKEEVQTAASSLPATLVEAPDSSEAILNAPQPHHMALRLAVHLNPAQIAEF
jgi:hypothetical protein